MKYPDELMKEGYVFFGQDVYRTLLYDLEYSVYVNNTTKDLKFFAAERFDRTYSYKSKENTIEEITYEEFKNYVDADIEIVKKVESFMLMTNLTENLKTKESNKKGFKL